MNIFSPQWMLLIGIILSFLIKRKELTSKAKGWSAKLLQASVILLGASLNFNAVINQGGDGVLITFFSILLIFILGFVGRKILQVNDQQGVLITMGTAICGGSAIGALAPIIRADTIAITVSISVVFLLNALAVFIFPWVGNALDLSQDQFGWWAALAIHDTSSVVAASSLYGGEALEIATTVKLIRALWIIPITLFFSFFNLYSASSQDGKKTKITIPWFIVGFLIMSMIFTFMNIPASYKSTLTMLAKNGFAITLFLIGLNFDWHKMKSVGIRPLLLGVGLWVCTSMLSIFFIKFL